MDLVELAVIAERRLAPGALDDVDGLFHALAAVGAAQAVADELVLVVDGALADADVDAALAEIVEQGELHGEPHRMVERHLHHGEADADALGLHRERGGEHQRVRIDALAGEIVLRQPHVGEAQALGAADLVDQVVDALSVLVGRGRHLKGKPAELHAPNSPALGG